MSTGLEEPEVAAPEEVEREVLLTVYVGETLEEVCDRMAEAVLKRRLGNRTHAAEDLGIATRTLQRRIKRNGIKSPI